MTPADPAAGLIAFLKADADTAALVEDRIFAAELPEEETAGRVRKALVIRASGGIQLLAGTFVNHETARFDVFAFGETPREAARVLSTAALALRQLRGSVHAGCLLHWANPASGPISGREPVTEWPRQFQSFQVMHGLVAIEE